MATREVLATVPFLVDLSAEELDELATQLRRRRFRKGEVIFVQGDPGSTLYLIEAGRVKISLASSEGREMTLALRGPGEFFGELSLLDGEPRSADATTQEASDLLMLQRADFVRFLEERPRVAVRLLTAVGRRLRHTTRQVEAAAFLDVPGRLAQVLLDLAEATSQPSPDGLLITSPLTQTELAALVGATRESVNKWLGFYERQGLIRREKNRMTVLRPQGLRKRVY